MTASVERQEGPFSCTTRRIHHSAVSEPISDGSKLLSVVISWGNEIHGMASTERSEMWRNRSSNRVQFSPPFS